MTNMKSKRRVGESVYYTSNYGTTEIGTIKKLNVAIEGNEHLGAKYVSIITDQYISGWPKCVTVSMSNISPIL